MEGQFYTVTLDVPVTFVLARFTLVSFEHSLSATIEPG